MSRTWWVLILAAVVACGGKSKPPPPPEPAPAPDHQTGGAMIDQAVGGDDHDRAEGEYAMNKASDAAMAIPSLVGLWVSDCAAGDEKGQFRRLTYNIGVDTWALRSETFADARCSKRKVLLEMAGTYELEGESQTVTGAWDTASAITSRALTADDKATATKLGKACKAKLAPGVATDIQASGCAALGELPIDKLCTEHDLAGVDEVRGELHTGLRGKDDLCVPERRPTAYGPTVLVARWNPTGNADCDAMGEIYEKLMTCPKLPAEHAGSLRGEMRTFNNQLIGSHSVEHRDEVCRQYLPKLVDLAKQMGC